MARESITLILFVFIMCLSSLCSSALGGGLFYACSDGTMDLQKFELSKCSNFGIEDVKTVVTGVEPEKKDDENATALMTTEVGDGLIPDQPIDDEAADPNLTFLDYFNRDRTRFAGNGVITSATNAAECAKLCFTDEVAMPNEGEKCQGFLSDDRTYCQLFPSIDSTVGEIHSNHNAYRLKEGKEGGGAVVGYNTTRASSLYTPDGGPKEYGGRHDVNCGGAGALTSFKFNKVGDQVNNSWVCINSGSGVFGSIISKQTPHNASGKSKGRNNMYWIDRHDVNCGNSFLNQWRLDQWSSSMRVNYQCTSAQTPRPDECESLTASGYSGSDSVGAWRGDEVRCPANKLLTQWKYAGDSISYTCCPKPA